MRIDVWNTPGALDALRASWRALFDSCPDAPVFLSWEWIATWWAHFGGAGQLSIVAMSENDEIVAIAPLMVTVENHREGLRFIGRDETTDYADILAIPERAGAAAESLLQHFAQSWGSRLSAQLEPLPEGSPILTAARRAGRSPSMATGIERLVPCPAIALPSSWDAYLAALPKDDRHELRRKLRRAEAAGPLAADVVVDRASLAAGLAEFYSLHQSSPDPKKARFLSPGMREFFDDVSVALGARGWTRLTTLRIKGAPVASALSFDRATTVALYNSGFDPSYRSYSPGVVLIALELQSAIDRGRKTYDFLRGDERYKYDFGAADRFVYRVRLG